MKDLFGIEIKEEEPAKVVDEVVLYKPKEKAFSDFFGDIDNSFTSSELDVIISSKEFRSLYKNKKVYEYDVDSKKKTLSSIVEKVSLGKSMHKADKVAFLALFLSNAGNLKMYFDKLPDNIKNVWRAAYANNYLGSREVASLLGCNGIIRTGYYGSRVSLHPDLAMFRCTSGKSRLDGWGFPEHDYFISITPCLYVAFYDLVCNIDKFYHRKIETLSSGDNLKIFKGEEAMVREFPLLLSFFKQGTFGIGDSKKVSVTMVKKVSKQIGMEEFFPDGTDRELSMMRASMLLNMFAYYMENIRTAKSKEKLDFIAKDLVDSICGSMSMQLWCLLPHIGGVQSNCLPYSHIGETNMVIMNYLSNNKDDCWHDVDAVIDYLSFLSRGDITLVFDSYAIDKQKLVNKRFDRYLGYGDITKHMGRPFIKAYLVMLASLGLLDIAYVDYTNDDVSWVEWVKYFRITNLGKYAFGHIDKYVPGVEADKKEYFELDPERLIVRSVADDNPYINLLVDMSTPIGGGRYKLSNFSFLRNCKTVSELDDKIDIFKQFVSNEWSETWKDFFASLRMKCNPLKQISGSDYLIYKLSPDNKDFISVLLSDEIIKNNTIRAEGYLLLIPKNNKKKVFDRLKDLGYMM